MTMISGGCYGKEGKPSGRVPKATSSNPFARKATGTVAKATAAKAAR